MTSEAYKKGQNIIPLLQRQQDLEKELAKANNNAE